ncbi:MAG: preprotein translocase subunit SecE [Clostridia bacterium]|nr:preprotein translocase subunit SecE [Clostridia bacterium]
MAKAKAATKKPNIFARMGKRLRETFSELKRVTWPSFPKVVKNTVVVLVLVVIFLVVVTVINYVLGGLLSLINGNGWSPL